MYFSDWRHGGAALPVQYEATAPSFIIGFSCKRLLIPRHNPLSFYGTNVQRFIVTCILSKKRIPPSSSHRLTKSFQRKRAIATPPLSIPCLHLPAPCFQDNPLSFRILPLITSSIQSHCAIQLLDDCHIVTLDISPWPTRYSPPGLKRHSTPPFRGLNPLDLRAFDALSPPNLV